MTTQGGADDLDADALDPRDLLSARHPVFTRQHALDAGITPDQIRWALTSHRWTALRRGHYTSNERLTASADDPAAIHRLVARAALLHLRCDAVVSHSSAALLHGIAMARPVVDVTVTTDRQARRSAIGVDVRTSRTAAQHRVMIDGLPVTSIGRTVVDIARTEPLEQALVVLDAALARRLASRPDLEALLHEQHRWPGAAAARAALEHADPRCRDAGQSWSRGLLLGHGVPAPEPDVLVSSSTADLGGYTFAWPDHRTLAALDPVTGSAEDQLDALRRRRRLDDDVRAHGYEVVSFSMDELRDEPQQVVRRLYAAFARGSAAA